ncbi:MAG: hypothetical protein ACOX7W_03745 [Christensenellales bacterium]|jgi:putative aldouronate transport system substrate-binding protein
MRKIICGLLTMLTVTIAMVSCAKDSNTQATEPPKTSTVVTPASTPTLEPEPTLVKPSELTVFTPQLATVENFETNRFTKYYEELTGIHINWITCNTSERDTQLNLSLTSKEYPDIYATSFTTSQIIQYAEAGVFRPLNDLIDRYAPISKSILDMDTQLKEMITAPDGNIYTLFYYLPLLQSDTNYERCFKLWIYQPWLKQTGMDMPDTIDEFKQILIYFRDHDMNGNGNTDDEIPLMGSYQYAESGSDPMYAIMNSFQLFPSHFLLAENGIITFAASTNEFRDGLRYLNDLFEEKLLAEETYVQDLNQFRSVTSVTSEAEMVVGVTSGATYARFILQSVYADAYEDFTAIGPLALTEGGPKQMILENRPPELRCVITSACKYPEAAIQWLDNTLEIENALMIFRGYEDEHWRRLSDNITPDKGIIIEMIDDNPLIPAGSSAQNSVWQNWTTPFYHTKLRAVFTTVYKEGTNSYLMDKKQGEANTMFDDCGVKSGIPAIVWCNDADIITEFTDLKTTIDSYVKQSYTQFILGTLDINDDAAWQTYLTELDNMGLERYLDVCEQYYFGK